MAFKRSAVRSRLSPPTQKSELFPLGKRVRAFRLYYRFEEEKRMLKKIKIILSIISIILNLALIVMLVNYQEEEE